MVSIPFWVGEIAVMFMVGTLLGRWGLRFRGVAFLAVMIFVLSVMIDPIIIPSYSDHLDFLLVGCGLASWFLVIGWAIATPSKKKITPAQEDAGTGGEQL